MKKVNRVAQKAWPQLALGLEVTQKSSTYTTEESLYNKGAEPEEKRTVQMEQQEMVMLKMAMLTEIEFDFMSKCTQAPLQHCLTSGDLGASVTMPRQVLPPL